MNSKAVNWGWESKLVGNLVVESRKFSGNKKYWLASMFGGDTIYLDNTCSQSSSYLSYQTDPSQ